MRVRDQDHMTVAFACLDTRNLGEEAENQTTRHTLSPTFYPERDKTDLSRASHKLSLGSPEKHVQLSDTLVLVSPAELSRHFVDRWYVFVVGLCE